MVYNGYSCLSWLSWFSWLTSTIGFELRSDCIRHCIHCHCLGFWSSSPMQASRGSDRVTRGRQWFLSGAWMCHVHYSQLVTFTMVLLGFVHPPYRASWLLWWALPGNGPPQLLENPTSFKRTTHAVINRRWPHGFSSHQLGWFLKPAIWSHQQLFNTGKAPDLNWEILVAEAQSSSNGVILSHTQMFFSLQISSSQ